MPEIVKDFHNPVCGTGLGIIYLAGKMIGDCLRYIQTQTAVKSFSIMKIYIAKYAT